ncbi:MAG: hypothetical protein ACOCRX_11310, partial [Candidatus Woesearchaeota archaeon]
MDESIIENTEKKYDSIIQMGRFGIFFKWPKIKEEISNLKYEYSRIAREHIVSYNKIESLEEKNKELEKSLNKKDSSLENLNNSLIEIKSEKETLKRENQDLNTQRKE